MVEVAPNDASAREPPLALRLFGAVEVVVAGRRVGEDLRRKARWLLARLALRRGAPVERAVVAGELWPESLESRALYNLRRELSALRRALGPEAVRLAVGGTREVGLDLAGAWVDALAFDDAVERADEASLAAAVALHRGPLLEGCLEEWALPERERREAACVSALERLARAARERGEGAAAAEWLQRALHLDPLRESAHRERIALLAASGEYAAAVAAYRALRRTLRAELGVEPDRSTTHLFEEIRAQARRRAGGGERRDVARAASGGAAPDPDRPPLPAPLTTLVGRARERREVAARLAAGRLVTIAGPAGVGKTRLALAVAGDLDPAHADGTVFVPLGRVADPALLHEALAAGLGLSVPPGAAARDFVVASLRGREVLLVLDNCEHLVSAATDLAAELLASLPDLRVLATSRQSLALAGESVWRLAPLSVPDVKEGKGLAPSECLEFDGVQLFVERARAASPGFDLDAARLPAVVEICARLEGLPLALELAAARARSLAPAEIADGLRDVLGMLRDVRGSTARHQRTLAAALDWSYALLTPDERAALRRLAAFIGPFSPAAAAAVCADRDLDPGEVSALLDALVDKSMIVHEAVGGGAESRYRLLEPLRQYAARALEQSGETNAALERHLAFHEALAEAASPHLFGGFTDGEWRARLAPSRADFRLALERCEGVAGRDARALRLAANLQWLWFAEGAFAEARRRLDAALADAPRPGPDRARALVARGYVAFWEGDGAGMAAPLGEAVAIFRGTGDHRGIAYAASILACAPGQDEPEALADEALAAVHRAADPTLTSIVLWWRGLLQERRGDLEGARASYEELLATIRAVGHATGIGHALYPLGRVLLALGDLAGAERSFEESLRVLAGVGNRWGMFAALAGRALVAHRAGHPAAAARLLGAADAVGATFGAQAPPREAEEAARLAAGLEHELGAERFAALRAAGAREQDLR